VVSAIEVSRNVGVGWYFGVVLRRRFCGGIVYFLEVHRPAVPGAVYVVGCSVRYAC
jgi:hypothetical protein